MQEFRKLMTAAGASAVIIVFAGCSSKPTAPSAPPPAPVTVSVAARQAVPIQLTAIGNVQAYRTVQVKSMADGQIDQVNLKQGEYVNAGQLLFELDKRPFLAALHQAEGNLAKDAATAANNEANAARAQALLKEGVLATQDAQAQQAAAQSSQASVQADKAAVETAKVNLGYTSIRAPIAARAGEILVNLGNLVKANDTTALTTLNQIEPIYVSFTIPEAQLQAVRAGGIGKLPVRATQPDGAHSEEGALTFVDNAVDPTTGTIKLMATFPNRDRQLWPGQYLNVTLQLGIEPNATVVPATALQTGASGTYVYVVQTDGTATLRPVKSGRSYQQMAVIDSGVKPGEQVVVDGQIGVIPNSKVNVVKTVATTASAEQVAQTDAVHQDSGAKQ